LSVPALGIALIALLTLAAMNRSGVAGIGPYLVVGALLWLCVLESGVHATLAGVATALAIPLAARGAAPDTPGPLATLEHRLRPWVAFGILPVFAFANAGVPLEGVGFASLGEPIRLGISSGLVLGKAIGVFGVSWLMVRTGLVPLPKGTSLGVLFGVALLCGIGFTMSLFIGTLAFPGPEHARSVRLGVIGGSIVAATLGATWLALRLRHAPLPSEVQ
jgi:NhaA family Na+:H+ antiporter